ncbi:MAG TPA: TlpA disulfide reductase family protein [Tenuifilaceae bacterium]|nr:TlpA disulfide reductase family protein [Tenuifilaceae bacterium]HPQ34829.1 TlpA disulfide reductase family protein [Tenuifilaceae bacterium]HRX68712.1 TlpA disulfide reductase family protein [Tenuifilaceae bacterium]
MKKGIAFLSIVLLFSACAETSSDVAVFKGKLMNAPENMGLLMSKGLTDTISINDDGTFRIEKNINSPSYFTFRFGRSMHTIFLVPGDSLMVELDLKSRSNQPVYSGSIANINTYLQKASKISKDFTADFRGLFSNSSEVFNQKLDSVKSVVEALLASEGISNRAFLDFEKQRLEFQKLNFQFLYPNYNARLQKKEFKPDSVDYSFMDALDLSNESNLHINEYASLVNDYIQNLHYIETIKHENKGKSNFEMQVMYFDMIDSLVQSQEVREFIKHKAVIETIQWESLETAKNLYEYFMKQAVNVPYKKLVENAYNSRMMLAPGAEAPAFSLTGIDGKVYNLFDFRGKLVYIDFWASWCAPCRAEIPHLLKLKEEYKNKPIVFIGISLDDDIEAWEKMVEDQGLKGYQLHAENAWSSDVAKKYQIKGVPTFVLIDAEGNFIEYNVARPSNPEIKLIIDKHLKSIQ